MFRIDSNIIDVTITKAVTKTQFRRGGSTPKPLTGTALTMGTHLEEFQDLVLYRIRIYK